MELHFQILTILLLAGTCLGRIDPCLPKHYRVVKQSTRSTGYDLRASDTPSCDSQMQRGWYRFVDDNGKSLQMPTTCPGLNTCGSKSGLYLNGNHPAPNEDIHGIMACGKLQPGNDCCQYEIEISVQNCGAFFVYQLYPVNATLCPVAYCMGNAKRCPVGKWSKTNYEPCKDVAITLGTPPKVTGPNVHDDRTFDFRCEVVRDYGDPDQVYEVTWTFNGNPDPSVPPMRLTGNQKEAILLGDRLKTHLDTEISVKVTAFHIGQEQHKTISNGNSVYFGVKTVELTGPTWSQADIMFIYTATISAGSADPDQKIEYVWTFDGVEDPNIPSQIIAGGGRSAILKSQFLKGHLNSNIACQARLVYDNYNIKTSYKKSNTLFVGIRYEAQKVEIKESEGEKLITLVSTIPIRCIDSSSCCLTFNLLSNVQSVTTVKNSCSYKVCASDWDATKQQSLISFTLVPNINYIASGTRSSILSFGNIAFTGNGPIARIFDGFKINPLPIEVKVEPISKCALTGDPHISAFDYKTVFHLYQVGDYVAINLNYRDFTVQVRTWKCYAVTCVCGIVIKERNNVIRINGCDKPDNFLSTTPEIPYALSAGTVVQRAADGSNIGILLPSGTSIKINLYQNSYVFMDTYIQLPAFDNGKARGICGTNDGNPDNDFTYPTGKVAPVCSGECIPKDFTEAWRVSGTASFLETTPPRSQDKPAIEYCPCTANTGNSCSNRGHVQEDKIVCPNCQDITSSIQPKRLEDKPYDPPRLPDVDVNKGWPNAKGVTEAQAFDLCMTAIRRSPKYSACQNDKVLIAAVRTECMADIRYGGTTETADAITSSFTTKCQLVQVTDPGNYEKNNNGQWNLQLGIVDLKCPGNNNCKPHGTCASTGRCQCQSGWEGDSCETEAVTGIHIEHVQSGPGCLSLQRTCDSIEVVKVDVPIKGKLQCRIYEINVQGMRTGNPDFVDAINVSPTRVTCPLPKTTGHKYTVAVGYGINKFGNEIMVVPLDNSCLVCTGVTCTNKSNVCTIDKKCYAQGEADKTNNRQVCDVKKNPNGWTTKGRPCRTKG